MTYRKEPIKKILFHAYFMYFIINELYYINNFLSMRKCNINKLIIYNLYFGCIMYIRLVLINCTVKPLLTELCSFEIRVK